jgi:hypothetical protein
MAEHYPVHATPEYAHDGVIPDLPDPGPTGPEAAAWAAGLLLDAGAHVHLAASGQSVCLAERCAFVGVPQ